MSELDCGCIGTPYDCPHCGRVPHGNVQAHKDRCHRRTVGEELFEPPARHFSGTNFTIAPAGWLRCTRCGETVPNDNRALYEHVGKHQGEAPHVPTI